MKKFKKSMALALSATMVLSGSVTASEITSIDNVFVETPDGYENIQGISADLGGNFLFTMSRFGSFTGEVEEVHEMYDGRLMVEVENQDGNIMMLIVNADTFMFGEMPQEGDIVTGFYDNFAPIPMIYPPQHVAQVLVNKESEDARTVHVDTFDGELISSDGTLRLNIGENTQIVDTYGNVFDGDIHGRDLLVVYGVSTRSIPALTTPYEIVVLPLQENGLIFFDFEVDPTLPDIFDLDGMMPTVDPLPTAPPVGVTIIDDVAGPFVTVDAQIVVNGVELTETKAAVSADSDIMWPTHVPLRAVVEALGYEVVWHPEFGAVAIGERVSFNPGFREFLLDGYVVELEAHSVIVDGVTFVPFSFFRELMGMNNAYFSSGQIVVNNDERME